MRQESRQEVGPLKERIFCYRFASGTHRSFVSWRLANCCSFTVHWVTCRCAMGTDGLLFPRWHMLQWCHLLSAYCLWPTLMPDQTRLGQTTLIRLCRRQLCLAQNNQDYWLQLFWVYTAIQKHATRVMRRCFLIRKKFLNRITEHRCYQLADRFKFINFA